MPVSAKQYLPGFPIELKMSPKFGLALLLLCFVLLGLSDAQQAKYRVRGKPMNRNSGGGPPIDEGVDCEENNLASGNRDRFKPGKGK